jgi:predicted nucleotidyltransferase
MDRLVLFGSYVTAKSDPNDIDILLVMRDEFDIEACDGSTRGLFDHVHAAERFGASIFWMRPALLLLETLEEFVAHWQIKRDQTRRGIVELRA